MFNNALAQSEAFAMVLPFLLVDTLMFGRCGAAMAHIDVSLSLMTPKWTAVIAAMTEPS
jgi:hypothetical protein